MKILVLDHGSGYLPNLVDFLKDMNVDFDLRKPGVPIKGYRGVIASGGSLQKENRIKILEWYKNFLLKSNTHFLGICLGHRILGFCHGSRLMKSYEKGVIKISFHKEFPLAPGMRNMKVYQDHDFGLLSLPGTLENFASSKECEIQAIKVIDKQQYGVQFHPEVEGHVILENFIRICRR
jgi:GMP synthase (glutamine-hydrolysing)